MRCMMSFGGESIHGQSVEAVGLRTVGTCKTRPIDRSVRVGCPAFLFSHICPVCVFHCNSYIFKAFMYVLNHCEDVEVSCDSSLKHYFCVPNLLNIPLSSRCCITCHSRTAKV